MWLVTNASAVVIILYGSKVRFRLRADEWTLVLAYDNGKPELFLRIIHLCVYFFTSDLIHHVWFISMHICPWYLVANLLLKFLLMCLTIWYSIWQLCLLESSLSEPKNNQLSSIHLHLLSLVHGLTEPFNLGWNTAWMSPGMWVKYRFKAISSNPILSNPISCNKNGMSHFV